VGGRPLYPHLRVCDERSRRPRHSPHAHPSADATTSPVWSGWLPDAHGTVRTRIRRPTQRRHP
jgi:hypothetical protein